MRRSKYGAVATIIDNVRFASKKEAIRYTELKVLQSAGIIRSLELQFPFKMEINGVFVCKYVADFVYYENGNLIVEDVKGMRTPVYRLKKKLMLAIHGIEIKEV